MANHLDKEFDDLFSDELYNSSHGEIPSADDWATLNRRLDKDSKKVFAWWWILIPLLLGFNGWLGYEFFNLKSSGTNYGRNLARSIVINDTTYQTCIVYDTIYKTVVINKYFNQSTNDLPPLGQEPTQYVSVKDNMINQLGIGVEHPTGSIIQMKAIDNETSNIKIVENPEVLKTSRENTESDNLEKINEGVVLLVRQNLSIDTSLKIIVDPVSSIDSDNPPISLTENSEVNKKSWLNEISEFVNTKILEKEHVSYRIGVSTGAHFPLVKSTYEIKSAYLFNIQGEILFGRKWAIVPEVFYHQNIFDIYEAKYLSRLKLPQPRLQGDEFKFDSAEGLHREIMPAISLRYRFASDQIWSWYLSGGWTARFILPRDVEYEFNKANQDDVLYYVESVGKQAFKSYLKINIGSQLNINTRFALHSEIDISTDIGTSTRGFTYASGLIGLKYLIK